MNNPVVFDPATLAKALTCITQEIGDTCLWLPAYDSGSAQLQKTFLGWYAQNQQAVEALRSIKTAVSHSADELNAFLTDNGFQPLFRRISRGGIGAAAILNMLVEWATPATLTNMAVYSQDYLQRTNYRAFELPLSDVEIFDTSDAVHKLVKFNTKTGDAVWLIITDRPQHGLDLIETASAAMAARKPANTQWISSVVVPAIEIQTTVPLNWMLGISNGDHIIDQAFQLFNVRMDDKGAQAKVASGLATSRSAAAAPTPMVINQPFAGWFTQEGSEVPIAAFYADKNTWQKPQAA